MRSSVPEGSKKVFTGARLDVYITHVKGPEGNLIERDMIDHPGAVVLLPLLNDTSLLLIRNKRFAINKELWELPAGTLESGELPIETAKRELIEETGYKAAQIKPLSQFYTVPGFCNEKMHAFVAENLSYVGQALDETEQIIVEELSWENALSMVREGVIEDAKTIAVLLYYHLFYR